MQSSAGLARETRDRRIVTNLTQRIRSRSTGAEVLEVILHTFKVLRDWLSTTDQWTPVAGASISVNRVNRAGVIAGGKPAPHFVLDRSRVATHFDERTRRSVGAVTRRANRVSQHRLILTPSHEAELIGFLEARFITRNIAEDSSG